MEQNKPICPESNRSTAVKNQRFCDVWIVCIYIYKHMLKKMPGTDSDPAFCLPSKCSNRAVTYWKLQNFIKRHVAKLGLDPRKYSSHGIRRANPHGRLKRRSRATYFKIQGDWSSDASLEYIDCNIEQRMQVARDMVNKIRELNKEWWAEWLFNKPFVSYCRWWAKVGHR